MNQEKTIHTSLPVDPNEIETETVESIYGKLKHIIKLPPESHLRPLAAVNIKKSRKIPETIIENMSVPYDISYRRNKPSIYNLEPLEMSPDTEPTIINVIDHYKPKHISAKRETAQHLIEKLAVIEENNLESDDLLTQVDNLSKSVESYKDVLVSFIKNSEKLEPERVDILNRVANHLFRLGSEMPGMKEFYEKKMAEMKDRLEESIKRRNEAEEELQLLRSNVERTQRSLENRKRSVEEIRSRCAQAENDLRDAINNKNNVSRGSSSDNLKLQQLEEQIAEKLKRLEKLRHIVEALKADLESNENKLSTENEELEQYTKDLQKTTDECKDMDSMIESIKKKLEEVQAMSIEEIKFKGKAHAEVQVNYESDEADKLKNQQKHNDSDGDVSKSAKKEFIQNKDDLSAIQHEKGEDLTIKSKEDLLRVREIILNNNNIFDWSSSRISKARLGSFPTKETSEDESRLYAQWVIGRVMKRVLTCKSRNDCSTQTDAALCSPQLNNGKAHEHLQNTGGGSFIDNNMNDGVDSVDTTVGGGTDAQSKSVHEYSNTMEMNNTRVYRKCIGAIKNRELLKIFTNSKLPTIRGPKPINWVIHSIRGIYDEKTVDDQTEIQTLPSYLLQWGLRQFGSPELREKGIYDLIYSSQYYEQRSLEVALFCRFLDNSWTVEQLTFFLKCRLWILKRSVSIAIQVESIDEYLLETFLTRTQVIDFFNTHFPENEKELIKHLQMRGCNCADPKRGGIDSANIPMIKILEIAIIEQIDAKVRKMRRMLAYYRLLPKMTMEKFSAFVFSMIPNIDPTVVDSLFRSSLVPNSMRTDIDARVFRKKYMSGDPFPSIDFSPYSDLYARVHSKWRSFLPFLSKVIRSLEQRLDDESKFLVSQINHNYYMLLEAKSACDSQLFNSTYHKVLGIVIQTCLRYNLPEASTFLKQATELEDHIFSKAKALDIAK